MTKKPENTASKATQSTSGYTRRYKIIFAIFLGVIVLMFLSIVARYNSNQDKFSDKDYAVLGSDIERIFSEVGAGDVARNSYCRYTAPEKYANKRLYCSIERAAYMTYESDEQARVVAEQIEKKIQRLGVLYSDFGEFIKEPRNGSGTLVISLNGPVVGEQCNFYIQSNEKAKDVVGYAPKRTDDNLIALSFICDPESREQYFPLR